MKTIIDFEGNVYTTVILGTQEWIFQNLRTTHYADGTPIGEVTRNSDLPWQVSHGKYGRLYNWLVGGQRKEIIKGFRMPTVDDFRLLDKHLKTLKNHSKFNFQKGGCYEDIGRFDNVGDIGYFWSADLATLGKSGYYYHFANDKTCIDGGSFDNGFSIRLIREVD